jgi:sporulation protein YlmC with PRC-barrel domain
MSSLRNLLGRRVIDRASAEQVGKVAGVAIDMGAGTARFASVRLSGSSEEREFADWSHLTGSGEDAVVVDAAASLRPATGPLESRLKDGATDVIGKRVLTDHGNELGKVDDVEFDAASGEVEHVAVGADRVPGARLRSLGPYALVITCPHKGSCPG